MFRVEILKSLHRVRTWVFAAGLAALGVLPVIVLRNSPEASGGPAFFDQLRQAGLFAPLAAMALVQPFFLPLGTGLLAGEAVAGESSAGTLRYLLVRPVGRVRLILSKWSSVMAEVAAGVVLVALAGLVAGAIAMGVGPLPTLSGSTISTGGALLRIGFAAVYIVAGVSGLAAIGLFISVMTDSGPGAAVATVALGIVSQVLDNLASLRSIHPFLFSHRWLAFVDLFRDPVDWTGIIHGFVLAAAYTAVFLGAALVVFTRKDVVS